MKDNKVPYLSQHDSDSQATSNDCGPASVAMVLDYYGENIGVGQAWKESGAGTGYVTINQLYSVIENYGYRHAYLTFQTKEQLMQLLDSGLPVIVILKYQYLSNRQDQNFKGPHILVVRGYNAQGVITNDSDYYGNHRDEGDGKVYSWDDFMIAWTQAYEDGNDERSLIVIYPKASQPVVSGITKRDLEKSSAFDVLCNFGYECGRFDNPGNEGKSADDFIKWINSLIADLESNKKRAYITDKLAIDELKRSTSIGMSFEQMRDALKAKYSMPEAILKSPGLKIIQPVVDLLFQIDRQNLAIHPEK